jgi:glycosyltransferase involved in cell wall biosynthesis
MKWIPSVSGNYRTCIITRNAIHGGVETLIRMEQEALHADVIVAGGHNNALGTCPFEYRYVSTYKELLTALLDYDVVLYHWLPDWAVQAIAVSGVFSMEFVHRVDTAESSKTVPDLVLSHSQYVLDYIRDTTGRDDHMFVVPNGTDLSRYKPVSDRSKSRIIGAVTSYYERKGIDVLIRACRK